MTLLLLNGLLSACGEEAPASWSTSAPTAPTTTTTIVAVTTSLPSVWDVVAIGDSLVAGYGLGGPGNAFPARYADALGRELGVETVLHSHYSNDVRDMQAWADTLTADSELRSDLAAAEVVIVWLGNHNTVMPLLYLQCGSDWDSIRGCLEEATAPMPGDFDRILASIEGLVPPGALVMVANQGIAPLYVDRWGTEPFWGELKAIGFDGWWEALEVLAPRHGAIFVDSATPLNGPDGNSLASDDFILRDRLHVTEAGADFIAGIFLEADGLGE